MAPRFEPQCLITGCELFVLPEGLSFHGDLHRIGDTYIFNGNPNAQGTPGLPADAANRKLLTINDSFFSRRGLWVCPTATASLNQCAKDYLNASPRY